MREGRPAREPRNGTPSFNWPLFIGPHGTGKTLAAEVLAADLDFELFSIDLSRAVSKFIGETEKNLDRLFAAAADSNAILFFDEAEARFGKRSEVRDSHDRYANIEIAYLLQRMEQYDGLAILATNLRENLDAAFVRRVRRVVEFPFPDKVLRRWLWEAAFPSTTPVAELDFGKLAERRLTGGQIRALVLRAGFLAAESGGPVAMSHIETSLERDAVRRGQSGSRAQTDRRP